MASATDDSCEVAAAGKRYLAQLASSDEEEAARSLLQWLGPLDIRSVNHQRAFRLCLVAVRRPLARWGLPSVGPAAEIGPSLIIAQRCISAAPESQQLIRACHLDNGFIPPTARSENEFYAQAVFHAVAALARFALYAGLPDGVDTLEWAALADDDQWERTEAEMPYHRWLAEIALPAAYYVRELANDELNPGCGFPPRWSRKT